MSKKAYAFRNPQTGDDDGKVHSYDVVGTEGKSCSILAIPNIETGVIEHAICLLGLRYHDTEAACIESKRKMLTDLVASTERRLIKLNLALGTFNREYSKKK